MKGILINTLNKGDAMKICVFGAGSLGANAVINLARRFESTIEFILVDYDRIEQVNIANQPWYDVNVGQYKTSVLSAYIYRVCKAKSITINTKIESSESFYTINKTKLTGVGLCIDCFDNLPARNYTQTIAETIKCPIVHSGFAENVMLCKWGTEFPLKVKSRSTAPVCNRRDLGPLVTLGAGVTALVVGAYITDKVQNSAFLELNKGKAILNMG